jgi:hypothetical protein
MRLSRPRVRLELFAATKMVDADRRQGRAGRGERSVIGWDKRAELQRRERDA